jgi:hypothetical protein
MIFDKAGNGISEIRQYCQWVFGSNRFENLIGDLSAAEREVRKVVGDAVVDRAQRHYLSSNYVAMRNMYYAPMLNGNYTNGSGSGSSSGSSSGSGAGISVNDQLVANVQRVVALLAYREFTINNDVSHGPTGRRVMIDNENEKLAWEWMLEKDDDGLVKKANSAFDDLIEFLDKNQIQEWLLSSAYEKSRGLLLHTTEMFDNAYPIDKSRRLYMALVPIIDDMQFKYIKPVMGKYYEELILALKASVWCGCKVMEDLLKLAAKPLALFTMAEAVQLLSVKLLPEGLVQQYKSYITGRLGSFPVKQSEKEGLVKSIFDKAIAELRFLENYITNLETGSGSGSDGVDEEERPKNIAERMDVRNKFVRV